MLVFCNTSKRKLSFTFERPRVLAALPAIPLRDIPATGVRRPCSIPRFARQRHGTHVLLQGRQIAFERPCRHPRTSRRELSGEVFNCHLKPSNRSSDSKDVPCGASPQSSQRSRLLRVIGGGTSSLPYRLRRNGGASRPSKPPRADSGFRVRGSGFQGSDAVSRTLRVRELPWFEQASFPLLGRGQGIVA